MGNKRKSDIKQFWLWNTIIIAIVTLTVIIVNHYYISSSNRGEPIPTQIQNDSSKSGDKEIDSLVNEILRQGK